MGASDGLFIPGLLSLLGHRALKAHGARGARRATARRSSARSRTRSAINASTSGSVVTFRRRWPQLGTQRSMDALVAALDDPDGFLRYKAIAAIEKIRRDHPAISCPRAVLESQVVRRKLALLQRADAAAQPAASRAGRRRLAARPRAAGQAAPHDRSHLPSARPALSRRRRGGGEIHDRAGRGAPPRGGGRVSRQPARRRRAQARDADPGRLAADRKGPLRERRAQEPPARSRRHARAARARGRSGDCRRRRFTSSASASSGG